MPLPYPNTGTDCARIDELIQNQNGDRCAALGRLIGGSCSFGGARKLSIAFAHCFGLTEVEFMRCYRKRARLGQCTFEVFVDELFEPDA